MFGYSASPHIFSRYYRFRFQPESPQNKLAMITPYWIPEQASVDWVRSFVSKASGLQLTDTTGTAMAFPLKEGMYDKLLAAMDKLGQNPENFFFLNKIRRVSFNSVSGTSEYGMKIQEIHLDGYVNAVKGGASNTQARLAEAPVSNVIAFALSKDGQAAPPVQYLKVEMVFEVPKTMKEDSRQNVRYVPLSLAFPLDLKEQVLLRSRSKLFAFLPTNVMTPNYPCLINADFVLATSRESLDATTAWNKFLLKNALVTAYEHAFRLLAFHFLFDAQGHRIHDDMQDKLELLFGCFPPTFDPDALLDSKAITTALLAAHWYPTEDDNTLMACKDVIIAPTEIHDLTATAQGDRAHLGLGAVRLGHRASWGAFHNIEAIYQNTNSLIGNRPLNLWTSLHWNKHVLANSVFLSLASHDPHWFVLLFQSLDISLSSHFQDLQTYIADAVVVPTYWRKTTPNLVATAFFVDPSNDLDIKLAKQGLILAKFSPLVDQQLWNLCLSATVSSGECVAQWAASHLRISSFDRTSYLEKVLIEHQTLLPNFKVIRTITNLALRDLLTSRSPSLLKALTDRRLYHNAAEASLSKSSTFHYIFRPVFVCPEMQDLFGQVDAPPPGLSPQQLYEGQQHWTSLATQWLSRQSLHWDYLNGDDCDWCEPIADKEGMNAAQQLASLLFNDILAVPQGGVPPVPAKECLVIPNTLRKLDETQLAAIFPLLQAPPEVRATTAWVQRMTLFFHWILLFYEAQDPAFAEIIDSWKPLALFPRQDVLTHDLTRASELVCNLPAELAESTASTFFPLLCTEHPLPVEQQLRLGVANLQANKKINVYLRDLWLKLIGNKPPHSIASFEYSVMRYWAKPASFNQQEEIRTILANNALLEIDTRRRKVSIARLILLRPGDSASSDIASLSRNSLLSQSSDYNLNVWTQEMLSPELYDMLVELGAERSFKYIHVLGLWDSLRELYPSSQAVIKSGSAPQLKALFWTLLELLSHMDPPSAELDSRPLLFGSQWKSPNDLCIFDITSWLAEWKRNCNGTDEHRAILELYDAALGSRNIYDLASSSTSLEKGYAIISALFGRKKHLEPENAAEAIFKAMDDAIKKPGIKPAEASLLTRVAWGFYSMIVAQVNQRSLEKLQKHIQKYGIIIEGKPVFPKGGESWGAGTQWFEAAKKHLKHPESVRIVDALFEEHVAKHDLSAMCAKYLKNESQLQSVTTLFALLLGASQRVVTTSETACRLLKALKQESMETNNYASRAKDGAALVEECAWALYEMVVGSDWDKNLAGRHYVFHAGEWHEAPHLVWFENFSNLLHVVAPIYGAQVKEELFRVYKKVLQPKNVFFTFYKYEYLLNSDVKNLLSARTARLTPTAAYLEVLKGLKEEHKSFADAKLSALVQDAAWALYTLLLQEKDFSSIQDDLEDKCLLLLNGRWFSPRELFWLNQSSLIFKVTQHWREDMKSTQQGQGDVSPRRLLHQKVILPPHVLLLEDAYETHPRNILTTATAMVKRIQDIPTDTGNPVLVGHSVCNIEKHDYRTLFRMSALKRFEKVPVDAHLHVLDKLASADYTNINGTDHVSELISVVNELMYMTDKFFHSDFEAKVLAAPGGFPLPTLAPGIRFVPASRLALPASYAIEEYPDSANRRYLAAFDGPFVSQATSVCANTLGIRPVESFWVKDRPEIVVNVKNWQDVTAQWKNESSYLAPELASLLLEVLPEAPWLGELVTKLRTAPINLVTNIYHQRVFENIGVFKEAKSYRWSIPNNAKLQDYLPLMKRTTHKDTPEVFDQSELKLTIRSEFVPRAPQIPPFDPNAVFISKDAESSQLDCLAHVVTRIMLPWTPESKHPLLTLVLRMWFRLIARDPHNPKIVAQDTLEEVRDGDRITSGYFREQERQVTMPSQIAEIERELPPPPEPVKKPTHKSPSATPPPSQSTTPTPGSVPNSHVQATPPMLHGSSTPSTPATAQKSPATSKKAQTDASSPQAVSSSPQSQAKSSSRPPKHATRSNSPTSRAANPPSAQPGTATSSVRGKNPRNQGYRDRNMPPPQERPYATFDLGFEINRAISGASPSYVAPSVDPYHSSTIELAGYTHLQPAAESSQPRRPRANFNPNTYQSSGFDLQQPSISQSVPQGPIDIGAFLELILKLQPSDDTPKGKSKSKATAAVRPSSAVTRTTPHYVDEMMGSEEMREVGRKGEFVAWKEILPKIFPNNDIEWLNKDRESGKPYDFVIRPKGRDIEEAFVEVKASTSGRAFFWSLVEVSKALELGARYRLLHINFHGHQGQPTATYLPNPLENHYVEPLSFHMIVRDDLPK